MSINKAEALAKAEHYCAYQERSQQEVRDKLYSWGIWRDEVEELISELIQTNFLNEERFTKAYVSGKFNIKKWGKLKIKQGLRVKKVPEKMIMNALRGIDPGEYEKTVADLALKKMAQINESDPYKRKFKVVSYLMARGFEQELILEVLKDNNLS